MQVATSGLFTARSRWPLTDGAARAFTSLQSSSAPNRHAAEQGGNSTERTPGQSPVRKDETAPNQAALQQAEQRELTQLISRDQEVRAHEQAHAAVGGQYAGAPTYRFTQGPDGKRYSVSGEVSIDVSAVPNDPEATLRKMEVVIRAALAPAEPSVQDRQVVAQAQMLMAEARAELAQQRREDAEEEREARIEKRREREHSAEKDERPALEPDTATATAVLDLYRQIRAGGAFSPLIDLAV